MFPFDPVVLTGFLRFLPGASGIPFETTHHLVARPWNPHFESRVDRGVIVVPETRQGTDPRNIDPSVRQYELVLDMDEDDPADHDVGGPEAVSSGQTDRLIVLTFELYR
jgi:hypothetical protein